MKTTEDTVRQAYVVRNIHARHTVTMLYAGIDISLRRGQTLALLDGTTMHAEVCTVRDALPKDELKQLLHVLRERRVSVVAIDSPLKVSSLLLTDPKVRNMYAVPEKQGSKGLVYAKYRVCDFEMIRRALPLYQVAGEEERAAGWMRVGFDLARALRAAGYCEPAHATDSGATLLEVFPHAAFCALLGHLPSRKSTVDGARARRDALSAAGVSVEVTGTHDDLDALAGALTAMRWQRGEGCAFGHPPEGLIVLPVPRAQVRDRYVKPDLAAPGVA